MSLAEAFAPAEARYRSQILAHTFGHLAPDARRVYRIRFAFTCADYGGSIEVIASDLGDLPDSPWLFEHLQDFAADRAKRGKVSVFDGTYYMGARGAPHFKGYVREVPLFAGAT